MSAPDFFKESGALSYKHSGTNATRVEMRALAAASAYVNGAVFPMLYVNKEPFYGSDRGYRTPIYSPGFLLNTKSC